MATAGAIKRDATPEEVVSQPHWSTGHADLGRSRLAAQATTWRPQLTAWPARGRTGTSLAGGGRAFLSPPGAPRSLRRSVRATPPGHGPVAAMSCDRIMRICSAAQGSQERCDRCWPACAPGSPVSRETSTTHRASTSDPPPHGPDAAGDRRMRVRAGVAVPRANARRASRSADRGRRSPKVAATGPPRLLGGQL